MKNLVYAFSLILLITDVFHQDEVFFEKYFAVVEQSIKCHKWNIDLKNDSLWNAYLSNHKAIISGDTLSFMPCSEKKHKYKFESILSDSSARIRFYLTDSAKNSKEYNDFIEYELVRRDTSLMIIPRITE